VDENTPNEMISTGVNTKQNFGAFVVLDRDVDDEALTGWFIVIKFKNIAEKNIFILSEFLKNLFRIFTFVWIDIFSFSL